MRLFVKAVSFMTLASLCFAPTIAHSSDIGRILSGMGRAAEAQDEAMLKRIEIERMRQELERQRLENELLRYQHDEIRRHQQQEALRQQQVAQQRLFVMQNWDVSNFTSSQTLSPGVVRCTYTTVKHYQFYTDLLLPNGVCPSVVYFDPKNNQMQYW